MVYTASQNYLKISFMPSQPNILFLIADDHRYDAVGCNGDVTVRTPHLDQLAKGGANIRRVFTMGGLTGAVCIPSRAMLHCGTSTFRTSVKNDMDDGYAVATLKSENVTLGEALQLAGYNAHGIGKWHNDKASYNRSFNSGSEIFFGGMHDQWRTPTQPYDEAGQYQRAQNGDGTRHSTDVFCDAAIDFLEGYNEEKPFFLYVALTSPHDPRTAPEPFASMYRPQEMPTPTSFLPRHPFDNGDLHIRDEELASFPRTPEEIACHSADYYAMISHQDARIGDVLSTLSARGIDENTIVVYTSDHGLGVGRHGLMGKQNMYDHSVRVPLLMRGPGLPRGEEFDGLAYAFDLYPTLCELAGAAVSQTVEGQSLLPLLRGEAKTHRPHIGAVYNDTQRMWSDGEWKIIRYFTGKNGNGCERVQLFNLQEDPNELNDFSERPEQSERVRKLLGNLEKWQQEVGDII